MGLSWGCGFPSLTSHARGLLTSLVTLLLLQLGSAQLRVVGPGQPLTGTVGQDVVLPCHVSPQRDVHSLEIRWIRDSMSETVHHYRNGEDLYGEQMGAYAGRTELVRGGLSSGSLDLRIMGLRPSDDGLYICTVGDAVAYDEATVRLEVSATGADPHLSLGGYEAGGVRVLCRSAGWYPLPQLLWRDARGQHLPSVSQTHSQDQEGLSEIESAVTVTGSVEGPLSCVVRSSRLQQERESSLHIAAPFFINAQPLIVVLVLVLVLLAVSIGLGVYLFRKQATLRRELAGKLADQGAVEDEYRAKDVQQSARLKDLTEQLVRKDKELEEKAAELAQKDKRLAELSSELDECRAKAVHQSERLKDLTEELEKKDAKLTELKAEQEEKNVRLAHQSARLKDLTEELEKKDAKLEEQATENLKVTLDPRTAHPMLVLSQDNCSVRRDTERQQVPDTLERFDTSCCILGREEFREGRHCWEVEVDGEKGTYSSLAVGVARASVKRKGEINMSPEEGIWAVQYNEGQLTSLTSPPTPLSLSPVPTRLWVCLDCTQGQVSFINPDNQVEIFTFPDVFLKEEGMRPWFWLGTNAQLCVRNNTP